MPNVILKQRIQGTTKLLINVRDSNNRNFYVDPITCVVEKRLTAIDFDEIKRNLGISSYPTDGSVEASITTEQVIMAWQTPG